MLEGLLTLNPTKERVYRQDVHFHRAVATMLAVSPNRDSLVSFLWNHAVILLRPEAIVARRCRLIFPMLRSHGLIPVSVRCVHLVPEQARLIWHYQENVMTRKHSVLIQRLLAAGPSVCILVRDGCVRKSTPATGHVTYLKGPTLLKKRRPLHLRSLAGPAIANVLSYIHASDDPADLLRELAVLFPSEIIVEILREAAAGVDRTEAALAALAALEVKAPKGVFDAESNVSWEDDESRAEWLDILTCARKDVSYVSGETYDPRAASIPDSKQFLARLDDHLIFPEFGPGF